MVQYNYKIESVKNLNDILKSTELSSCLHYSSLLVQVFSAKNNSKWYYSIGNAVQAVFPTAVIIGASTVGEINEGKMNTDSTIIMFSFFETSALHLFSYECKNGDEEITGKSLIEHIESKKIDIKGMLLLSTPARNNSAKLLDRITACNLSYPIFGGGAGDYTNIPKTLVFDGKQCHKQGIVAVIFSGADLSIELFSHLGWSPLSKEMTITHVNEMSVKTIDGNPAFRVYEKYLGIQADDNFLQNVLEFPFLFNRNGHIIARVPFFVNKEEGSVEFLADIHEGEAFRIGYGNPQTIINKSTQIQNQMQAFHPDSIFLYSCICRRFLMQQDVDSETAPFNDIAPTAGFYTYGEFFANKRYHALYNSTLVAVGIREDVKGKKRERSIPAPENNTNQKFDPYENQHARILSRLLYFIDATTKELEDKNDILKTLNEQKNIFLGIVAHDLRNPIGAIHGISELIEKQVNESHQHLAKLITKVSASTLHLINDLLDISKIEANTIDLEKSDTDYITLVKQNVILNEFIAKNKKIKIATDLEKLPKALLIDNEKIEQVLNNLIGNAIKYSFLGSTIVVKVFSKENQIITQVIDQGQGIPEDEMEGIFNLFIRASIKPTGDENSHGLGLAIVKKIVEAHNGMVGVTSKLGEGSTFYFTLPI
jgi:signal transduction histidine kinase